MLFARSGFHSISFDPVSFLIVFYFYFYICSPKKTCKGNKKLHYYYYYLPLSLIFTVVFEFIGYLSTDAVCVALYNESGADEVV